jgi:hypothetical protein
VQFIPCAHVGQQSAPVCAASFGIDDGRLLFSGIAKPVTEQLRDVVDEPTRLGLGDLGKLIAPDLTGLAADPPIWLACVGVNAEGDELLAVAQQFNFLIDHGLQNTATYAMWDCRG